VPTYIPHTMHISNNGLDQEATNMN